MRDLENMSWVRDCRRHKVQHHTPWSHLRASCKEMMIKASNALDSTSAAACTKKITSSSMYWKASGQEPTITSSNSAKLQISCWNWSAHGISKSCPQSTATSGHVSVVTRPRHPWHNMTSGEQVVETSKTMRIAVAVQILMELFAAIAGKGILRPQKALSLHRFKVHEKKR